MKTKLMTQTTEKVDTAQQIGNTTVHKQAVTSSQEVDTKEVVLKKSINIVWLVIYLIEIAISLRIIVLLFGGNLVGFARNIYNLSNPMVAPFRGIFASPTNSGSYFDSAGVLALVIWYLLGYILTYIMSLFSNQVKTGDDGQAVIE